MVDKEEKLPMVTIKTQLVTDESKAMQAEIARLNALLSDADATIASQAAELHRTDKEIDRLNRYLAERRRHPASEAEPDRGYQCGGCVHEDKFGDDEPCSTCVRATASDGATDNFVPRHLSEGDESFSEYVAARLSPREDQTPVTAADLASLRAGVEEHFATTTDLEELAERVEALESRDSRSSKIHYDPAGSGYSECGQSNRGPVEMTDDTEKVTCGKCKTGPLFQHDAALESRKP